MKHGSLFSGIGGFDLAATWMGWDNVFHCERDEFCQRVLQFYWPKAKSYANVREFEATEYRGVIDVLSGGFPCQPFSVAGKRKGTEDDRYLWPEMHRIINAIQPRWVVGENVLGLLNWQGGVVFEQVQTELEASGYQVWPYVLPAAGINAPHKRDRIWIVAHASGDGCGGHTELSKRYDRWFQKGMARKHDADALFGSGFSTDADGNKRSGSFFDGVSELFEMARAALETKSSPRAKQTRWKDFPLESPFCIGDDGFSSGLDDLTFSSWREKSLHSAGNAIVPGVALEIFKTIGVMEEWMTVGVGGIPADKNG